MRNASNLAVFCTALVLAGSLPCLAGASGGGRHAAANIESGKAESWVIAFDADAPAQVTVSQKQRSAAAISLNIFDSDGNQVAAAGGDGHFVVLTWAPTENQSYTIVVTNLKSSKTDAVVDLTTN